ncbi:hypothetical protein B0H13DRAFT_1869990 [Mycena leptocephala]|nr:hypothetical protein B0H13DRAFT_1869990 [Mycena leptocephala]
MNPQAISTSTLLEEVVAVGENLGPAEGESTEIYTGEGQLTVGSISPVDQDALSSYFPHRLARVELDWALRLDREDAGSNDEQDGVNHEALSTVIAGLSRCSPTGWSNGSPGNESEGSSQKGGSDSEEKAFVIPCITAKSTVQPRFSFKIDPNFFPTWVDLSEDEGQVGPIPEEWEVNIKQEEVEDENIFR